MKNFVLIHRFLTQVGWCNGMTTTTAPPSVMCPECPDGSRASCRASCDGSGTNPNLGNQGGERFINTDALGNLAPTPAVDDVNPSDVTTMATTTDSAVYCLHFDCCQCPSTPGPLPGFSPMTTTVAPATTTTDAQGNPPPTTTTQAPTALQFTPSPSTPRPGFITVQTTAAPTTDAQGNTPPRPAPTTTAARLNFTPVPPPHSRASSPSMVRRRPARVTCAVARET